MSTTPAVVHKIVRTKTKGAGVFVRASASTTAQELAVLRTGDKVIVQGQPFHAGGVTWQRVWLYDRPGYLSLNVVDLEWEDA